MLRSWLPPAGLFLAAVLGWEAAVRLGGAPPWLLPAPSALPGALFGARDVLLHHTLVTLGEVALGLGAAIVAGLVIAVAIAWSPTIERAFYPLVVASQTLPLPVLAPPLVILLGYGIAPKVLLVALIAFFPIVVNTVDGLRGVDRELLDLLRTFGATRWQIFTKVRWPAALPPFFSGLRVAAPFGVVGAVFGELIGAGAGLGYYIRRETPYFHTAEVYGATLILALLGIGSFLLIRGVEWLALPWRRARDGGRGA